MASGADVWLGVFVVTVVVVGIVACGIGIGLVVALADVMYRLFDAIEHGPKERKR